MKSSCDRLAERLTSELGADAVKGEPALLAAHRIDGKEPGLLCFPADFAEVAVALRLCSEIDAAVAPWGGGTAISVGNPPRRLDVVMGLHRLNLLMEHDQANLTATAQSGITLAALQKTLARQHQFLPFDPPTPARATIGGIVATNLNGPRRSYYGSVRDLVIGMKVVLASGEAIKAGGKVVKNVAGYDMCKLFVGSLGTLGIITEVTLRMAPIPEAAATLVASGTLPGLMQLTDVLLRSKLFPSAVVLLNTTTSKTESRKDDWRVAIWCEGFEKSVRRQLHESQETAVRMGLASEIVREPEHTRLWQTLHDFPLQADRLVYRVIVPSAAAMEVIQTVHSWSSADVRAEIVGDAVMGILWISLEANDGAAKWFVKLMAEAQKHRGHAVMLAAPPDLKQSIDVWGSAPPALSFMRELKRQFDPKYLLNPGRFIGGM
jgi:glycolate oxidase FAD binding subunit